MKKRQQILLFFSAAIGLGAAGGIFDSIFNNYLSDSFHMSAHARGALEFPRELPGMLLFLMTGLFAFMAVTRIGALGGFFFALGALGMAFFSKQYGSMVIMLLIYSTGMHLMLPVNTSVAITLSRAGGRGARIGQMNSVRTLGTVLGCGAVLVLFRKSANYRAGFIAVAALGALTGLIYFLMHIPHLHQSRRRFVFKKKYSLYYVLELCFGARKQIFLTFGPWVLIRVYGMPAAAIAGLLMTASVIGVFFKPLAGKAIDHFGERKIMIVDGVILCVVCLGYGYAMRLGGGGATALYIAYACFILDNLLFSLGSARAVYVSRLTEDHHEVTTTLSTGTSINHVASMSIPFFAGLIWQSLGYETVFLGAAILALGISAISSLVPAEAILKKHTAA